MASGYPTTTWPHDQFKKGLPEPSIKLPTLHQLMSDQFFLGFDEQIKRWNTLTSTKVVTFPPYNLIKSGEDHYTVELAVAGYSKEDIEITVEKDLLTVKSIATEEESTDTVLHQGIAKRQWTQKFVSEAISLQFLNMLDGCSFQLELSITNSYDPCDE